MDNNTFKDIADLWGAPSTTEMHFIKPKFNKVAAQSSDQTQNGDYNISPLTYEQLNKQINEQTQNRPLSSPPSTEFDGSGNVLSDTTSDYYGQKFVEAVTAVLNND